jgi:hypothetical protein
MIQLVSILGVVYVAMTMTPVGAPTAFDGESPGNLTAASAHSTMQSGLKIVMDPATGKILENPTAAELQTISSGQALRLPRRSSWDLRAFPLDGGGEGVVLDEWAHHSLTVTRTDHGEFRVQCAQGDAHQSSGQEPVEEER